MSNHVDEESRQVDSGKSESATRTMQRLGIALILLSGVCFFCMVSVPWWPLGTGQKAAVGTALFVAMQVAWWVGAGLVGPAAIGKIRSRFRRRAS